MALVFLSFSELFMISFEFTDLTEPTPVWKQSNNLKDNVTNIHNDFNNINLHQNLLQRVGCNKFTLAFLYFFRSVEHMLTSSSRIKHLLKESYRCSIDKLEGYKSMKC